ncbi:MAG: hypothetical protein HDS83_06065 [Bacteroidales bacterium]|nr:hypothetical protein [Bacteroidales bacterium]
MKKLFPIILLMITLALPAFAKDGNEDEDSDADLIGLEFSHTGDESPSFNHRSTFETYIDAYYNPSNHIINICYYGENNGEVFLYLNNTLVNYSPDLNTTFQLTTSGFYKIVIIEKSWIATGYISI